MSLNIPTTQALKNIFLSLLESALNQESPLSPKAFLRVVSNVWGAVFTTLYKFAAQETKENLAISASRAGLIRLGLEYDTPIKAAESAVLTVTQPATDGTTIPATIDWVGDPNGIRYGIAAITNPATSSLITTDVTAKQTGATGNLLIGQTLTIGTSVAGLLSNIATVTAIINTGAAEEDTESYRARLLQVIRSPGGGGNAADYRNWSNEVAGVENSYPFSGDPTPGGSPPDRTVFVEATEDIDLDGIAPTSLLNEVRASITTDPITGLSRQPLGLTDDTLCVVSISRTNFFVEIRGLSVDPTIEAQVKIDIENSLTAYFKALSPWIDGLDPAFEKNDTITDPSITVIIQDIALAAGGSILGVGFGLSVGTFESIYTLTLDEHAKLSSSSGVIYA